MAETPDRDAHTGTATTGHEWDGIRELNTPLPRWWLWVFYATVLWSIGYWIAMPAWPLLGGYTRGVLGYSQRQELMDEMTALRAGRAALGKRILAEPLGVIRADPSLLEFAVAGGRSAFAVNCSQCHGGGAAGAKGYPNLNDDAWLWGGTLSEIYRTIRFGVRSGHEETHDSAMPAFLTDEVLTKAGIADVAEYVLSLSGRSEDAAAAKRGTKVYAEQCAACHGAKGQGNKEFGAPALADAIWLYGGDRETIIETIAYSRRGVMPAWEGRLDAVTLKQLAVYVHSLGGGR